MYVSSTKRKADLQRTVLAFSDGILVCSPAAEIIMRYHRGHQLRHAISAETRGLVVDVCIGGLVNRRVSHSMRLER